MGTLSFERPPLVEVSFGVMFSPLRGLRAAHYGALWSRFKDEFGETEDKPPVFGDPLDPPFTSPDWFPLPRVWFVEKGGGSLIQFQPNRFYFNWRRVPADAPYPRFAVLAPRFMQYLATLSKFVQDEKLGELDVCWTELAYINHVFAGEGWQTFADVSHVFPDLSWRTRNPKLPNLEGVAWKAVFDVGDIRVSGEVKSAKDKPTPDGRNLFSLDLRASSRHSGPGQADIEAWFHTTNEVIVRSFGDLTSERMQKEVWKRVGD